MARKKKIVESTPCSSDYLSAVSGHHVLIEAPDFSAFSYRDLAWPLACECRFGNQLPPGNFYSVAQHSLLCAAMYLDDIMADSVVVEPGEWDVVMALLLHDMHEGLLRDISTPLKDHLPGYRELEARFSAAIHRRFELPDPDVTLVKRYDQIALMTEREVFGVDPRGDWSWCKAESRAKIMSTRMRAVFAMTIGEAALALEKALEHAQFRRGARA